MLETFVLLFVLGPMAEALEPNITPLERLWKVACHLKHNGVWVSPNSNADDGYAGQLPYGCQSKERS